MIAVIFEVTPAEGQTQGYLDHAAGLRPLLASMPGFISIERFQSLTDPGKLLSLSFWEDEEAVRSFAARALRMRGYQVLEAGGGEEALEIVKQGTSKIDLIITDVVMPNMDGPTMVRAVKAMNPALPVIFMSGYAEEAFRRNDQNSEDIHFLPKPFGLKQLAAKVKEVLSA